MVEQYFFFFLSYFKKKELRRPQTAKFPKDTI